MHPWSQYRRWLPLVRLLGEFAQSGCDWLDLGLVSMLLALCGRSHGGLRVLFSRPIPRPFERILQLRPKNIAGASQ